MNLTPIRMSEENMDAKIAEEPSAEAEVTPETPLEEEIVEEEGAEDAEPSQEEPVPFHKHPRWQAREERLKELEAKLLLMEKESENARRLSAMTPEERQAFESAKKLNLVTKFDLEEVNERHAAETSKLKEEIAIKDFLVKYPSAQPSEQAIRELSKMSSNAGKSYEDIYKEYFGAERKVIKRTVRTGVKPIGGANKDSGVKVLTASAVQNMTPAEYAANRTEIMQMMKEGKLS